MLIALKTAFDPIKQLPRPTCKASLVFPQFDTHFGQETVSSQDRDGERETVRGAAAAAAVGRGSELLGERAMGTAYSKARAQNDFLSHGRIGRAAGGLA